MNRARNRSSRRWLAVCLTAVALIAVVIVAFGLTVPNLRMRLKRAALALWSPHHLPTPSRAGDETSIRRQVESRLRAEMEERLEREIAALRSKAEAEAPPVAAENANPEPLVGSTVSDVRNLRSGIRWKSDVILEAGGTSSAERTSEESYIAHYQLRLRLPTAAATAAALEQAAPGLTALLPSLPELMQQAQVSPWFDTLVREKVARVRRDASRLNELPTKHNLYDCETILNLTGRSGRKVMLIQAEMDVVSDGSDGDRLPQMPAEIVDSTNYQPFTSYGWPKRTATPNPMLVGWEKRLSKAEEELANPSTTQERKGWLRNRIGFLKRGIADLKGRSFLIAEYDPFIVLPYNMLTSRDATTPKVGDFAVVIHAGRAYPAIVGDGGPTYKIGEASLRLAREINSQASPYRRPVSDLKVTYLVFPQSRTDTRQAPNYDTWRSRCHELLQDLGGLAAGVELHPWQDLLPAPTPAAQQPTQPAAVPTPR